MWVSGGSSRLLPNVWQSGTRKSIPVCRLKLCTWWSIVMAANLSLGKAAKICCIYCYPKKDPKWTFYYIYDCLHLAVLPLLVTLTTSYTPSSIWGIYKGLRWFLSLSTSPLSKGCVSWIELKVLDFSLPLLVTDTIIVIEYKLKPYLSLQRWLSQATENEHVYGSYLRQGKINGKKMSEPDGLQPRQGTETRMLGRNKE